nr:5788_t:CDS:2 [Entrophospora candida]
MSKSLGNGVEPDELIENSRKQAEKLRTERKIRNEKKLKELDKILQEQERPPFSRPLLKEYRKVIPNLDRRAVLRNYEYEVWLKKRNLSPLTVRIYCRMIRMLKIYGKGNKIRHVFLPPFLQSEFKFCSSEYLFTNGKGERIGNDHARKMVFRKVIKAGMDKNISPHTFRRSFATLLNGRDCKLTTIQKLLGHSKMETTTNYIHNSYDELYQDYNSLGSNNSFQILGGVKKKVLESK